ncbi:conserved hypothetical protein [Hydrogenobacter thermophilus TK-6]|uniref:Uncharacterized protein n=1 Tax=Hydrogenobacter thermophilus (strain DSM 6534 / IAM 12695 / TK-6) TaxID=608538 RepID=D3DHM7_HYDTT|nr:hypothetical protein [Hydrogenobacter thermophilus]ADO45266.1 conserved hypothetical protein [Hydrogenobacter thermophilus TK-6]BAI69329.1 hypothetical protein HTH_0869 [Hydrogenobacter thermophilus TK-6]
MRFYGIASESRVTEVLEHIEDGVWFFEDTKTGSRERLDGKQVKEKLRDILKQVEEWKEKLHLIPKNTVFVFVHEPSDPKAFKIYDTSSLGCASSLSPPRWKIYKEGVQIKD